MSDYRPATGKHLEILEEMEKLNEELEGHVRSYPWFGIPNIGVGHAIEGVRCNGHQRLNSALEPYDGYLRMEKTLKETLKRVKKSLKTIEKAKALFESEYKVCPECKGEHGERKGMNDWHDCGQCNGNGFVDANHPPLKKAVLKAASEG